MPHPTAAESEGAWLGGPAARIAEQLGVSRGTVRNGFAPRAKAVADVVAAVVALGLTATAAVAVVTSPTWRDVSLIDGPVPLLLGAGGHCRSGRVLLAGRDHRWW